MSRLAHYPVVYKSFFDFRDLLHTGTVFGVEYEFTGTLAKNILAPRARHARLDAKLALTQNSLGRKTARARSYSYSNRDPSSKIFFRRAVHMQSFQSPCTFTKPAYPWLLSSHMRDQHKIERVSSKGQARLVTCTCKAWSQVTSLLLRDTRNARA